MTTTELPDQSDLPVSSRRTRDPDWSFVRSPRWIASHLFAAAMIVSFVVAMFWQLDRRQERIEQNEVIAARAQAEPPFTLQGAIESGEPSEVDFLRVADKGTWIDPDLVRIANRSQSGAAGQWVVGLYQTFDGTNVLVNRGFVELNVDVPDRPDLDRTGSIIRGWMRVSRVREGLAVADSGEGTVLPRLNVEAVEARLDGVELAPLWLQLDDTTPNLVPSPVPLPDQSNGPHLSYAVQWATFAILGSIVYGLLLRRIAFTRRP